MPAEEKEKDKNKEPILLQKIGTDEAFATFKNSLIKKYRERPKRL